MMRFFEKLKARGPRLDHIASSGTGVCVFLQLRSQRRRARGSLGAASGGSLREIATHILRLFEVREVDASQTKTIAQPIWLEGAGARVQTKLTHPSIFPMASIRVETKEKPKIQNESGLFFQSPIHGLCLPKPELRKNIAYEANSFDPIVLLLTETVTIC